MSSKKKLRPVPVDLTILKQGNHIPEEFWMQFGIQLINDHEPSLLQCYQQYRKNCDQLLSAIRFLSLSKIWAGFFPLIFFLSKDSDTTSSL